MQRKWIWSVVIIVVVIVAFLIVRFSLSGKSDKSLKATHIQPAASPIDLRPAIIAKLQSLIKTASDSIYDLSIEKIEPDILASTVDVFGAKLIPNLQALKLLDSLQQAPDDVFTISLDSLHIKGINIDDLLHTSHIDLDSIIISKPVITCNHQPKEYNRLQREKDAKKTMYQKLMGSLKSIKIKSIIVEKGTFISKQKNKKPEKIFNDVSMQVSDLLVDSSTEFDKQRMFFSKQLDLRFSNYVTRTSDSLYLFKIGSVQINATGHSLVANQVALIPRAGKTTFKNKLKYREDRFDIGFEKIVAQNIDWWSLTNNESFTSDEVHVYNATIKDYLDRSVPSSPTHELRNFPQQALMKVPLKINVKKINVHQLNVVYEELNPQINETGTITFDNMSGTITNISNTPAVMQLYKNTAVQLKGLFMNKVHINSAFNFDLSDYKTGKFSLNVNIAHLEKEVLNPVAMPLGLFEIKAGVVTKADIKLSGDNNISQVEMVMLYDDLHLIPLKKDSTAATGLKKKAVTSFIANTFLIKNANPAHGNDPRNVTVTVSRDGSGSFFNFIWKSILTAILKTIGVPEKYAR